METSTLITVAATGIAVLGFLGLLAKLRGRLADEGRLAEFKAAREAWRQKRAARRKAGLEKLRQLESRLEPARGVASPPGPSGKGTNGGGQAHDADGVQTELQDISRQAKEKPGEVASLLRSMMQRGD